MPGDRGSISGEQKRETFGLFRDIMAAPAVPFIVLAILFIAIKYLNQTDIPKVKNLPEVPGIPLLGSLLKLGKSHARSCAELVPRYGPVFQVRLGNRVSA